jgi:antitoxin ParD1/3/4
MEVTLTPELERRIAEKVGSGLYGSVREVVRESLRLQFLADEAKGQRVAQLHAQIRVGLDQLDRGESIPGDQVMSEIKELLESKRQP